MKHNILSALTATVAMKILGVPTSNGQRMMSTNFEDLWSIGAPTLTFDPVSTTFEMNYGIHTDRTISENLRVDILGPDCAYPKLGTTEGIVLDSLATSGTQFGRHVFRIETQVMAQNDILFSYSTDPLQPKQGEIDLCLRSMLWTGPVTDPNALEVNYLETLLTLYIDLTAGFTISDVSVSFRDRGDATTIESNTYEVEGYFCNPLTHERVDYEVVQQGGLVTVCVETGEQALKENIYLEGIQTFSWFREFETFNLTQAAIEDSIAANNGLTFYECTPGSIICHFQSILMADFYRSKGEVYGIGMAKLTFGANDDVDDGSGAGRVRSLQQQRKLQSGRVLQLEGTGFDLVVNVAPLDEAPSLTQTAGGVATIAQTRMMVLTLASGLVMGIAWIVLGGEGIIQ